MTEVAEPVLLDSRDVEITEKDIKEALKYPDSFGYFGPNKEMFKTWSIGPVIVHRDSDPRVQSNARALKKKLESDPTLNDEWNVTQCSCSMVGWVDHLSFHAIDAENKPTRIFRFLKQWFEDLKDDIECNGGVADEADLDSLVHELSIRHFPHICRNIIIDNPPDGWESTLYHELRDNGNHDSFEELYPSEDEVIPILKDLGWLKEAESDSNADDSDSKV